METLCFQIGIAARVIIAFGVLRSVGLDNEPVLEIDEIGDIVIDDDLALKLIADEAFRAEDVPHLAFSFSRVGAHPFGASEEFSVCGDTPSPSFAKR